MDIKKLEKLAGGNTKEKPVEEYLVGEVKKRGGTAYKFTSPQRRSVPDRLCLFPLGRTLFVECKAAGARPTEGQQREHIRLQALGFKVYVVSSKAMIDRMFLLEMGG